MANFTPLEITIIGVQGDFVIIDKEKNSHRDIEFQEEELIDFLNPGGAIKAIECNYGIKTVDGYSTEKPPKTSNRGRKPEAKPKKERVRPGNGKCFNSQITWHTENDNGKIFKIKLFRNGRFQVPGVQRIDFGDVKPSVKYLKNYLASVFVEDIELKKDLSIILINFKCRISENNNYHVNVMKLVEYLNDYQTKNCSKVSVDDLKKIFDKYTDGEVELDKDLLVKELRIASEKYAFNKINVENEQIYNMLVEHRKGTKHQHHISEGKEEEDEKPNYSDWHLVLNKIEKTFAYMLALANFDDDGGASKLTIQLFTPTPEKPKKTTTVNIYDSNRINIKGASSVEYGEKIYKWTQEMVKRYPEIIYDISEY